MNPFLFFSFLNKNKQNKNLEVTTNKFLSLSFLPSFLLSLFLSLYSFYYIISYYVYYCYGYYSVFVFFGMGGFLNGVMGDGCPFCLVGGGVNE